MPVAEVWAGMATLTDRHASRATAVTSLITQVDRLTVIDGGTLGDQAKFLTCAEAPEGVIFLGVDDDLIYPPDYVETLLAGLARHPGCIVSFHGYSLTRDGEIATPHRCLEPLARDIEAHVIGTGVCAFHIETLRPLLSDFGSRNAADAWISLLAEQHGIRRVVLAHPGRWFAYTEWPATVYSETVRKTGSPLDGSAGKREAFARLLDIADVTLYPVVHSIIAAPTGDHVTATLATGNYYEADLLAALARHAAGGTVIDVGANIGNHTAFFAGETAAARVIAIEPNVRAYRLLQRTIAASGRDSRVEAIHAAVHPEWERANVTEADPRNIGMTAVSDGDDVPVIRLDDFASENVRIVKVDTEGMSADVLRSGLRLISARRPVLAVEERDKQEARDVKAVLAPLGYVRGLVFGSTPTRIWLPSKEWHA